MGGRRHTHPVKVGNIMIGGDNPVVVQSMTTTSTMDTDASVQQVLEIANAGGEVVRLTAQGEREARNLQNIHEGVRKAGCSVPLVADIHFNPKAAFEAAKHVEKVRINPGNFVDPGRTFRKLEFTDAEYAAELQRIDDALTPFLELCRQNGTAVRLGVNHGSLSDRIMSRYGDTPAGMVESAMEFLRVAVRRGFPDIVISIKASNVTVMTTTVRMLVKAMEAEGMDFPLHLGVTEAGDGDEARIKSAVGIGSLLADGIGDTIRVSLSEAPANEIPVGKALVEYITDTFTKAPYANIEGDLERPRTVREPKVIALHPTNDFDKDRSPDGFGVEPGMNLLKARYHGIDADAVKLRAAVDLGSLLLKGIGDAIAVDSGGALSPRQEVELCFSILQACRLRITQTEYIACPGCGRTMFDLQQTLEEVRRATRHLQGLKIAVMGCIVNGPGEMADADYGYVGAGAGRVSLYKGKVCVKKNIPQEQAVETLLQLLGSEVKQ